MFKTFKKRFSKNISLGNKKSGSPRKADERKQAQDEETTEIERGLSSKASATADSSDSFSNSGRKSGRALSLSDKLKSISIKDKSITRSSGRSRKILSGPTPTTSSVKQKQEGEGDEKSSKESLAAMQRSMNTENPSAAATEMQTGYTSHFDPSPWESFPSEEDRERGEETSHLSSSSPQFQRSKADPPPFVSPIEEARRKWQQANFHRPEEDHQPYTGGNLEAQQQEQQYQPVPFHAIHSGSPGHESNESSREFQSTTDFLYDDSLGTEAGFVERKASIRNEMSTQRLCQVVHDFTADSEDELTVYTGDVVEVCREEDGWYLARVFNEDGSFEEGLIPASYCIEWNEDDSGVGSGPLSPRISPRPSLSRTSLNRAGTLDGSTFSYNIQPPISSAYLELCEVLNAKFEGNKLEKYGVHGLVKISDTYKENDNGDLLEFDIVPSNAVAAAAEGEGEGKCKGKAEEGFEKARFYLNNALRDGSKVMKEDNRVSVELDSLPSSFAKSRSPLLKYSLDKGLYHVPLIVQVSWCRKEGFVLPKRKTSFVACVSLTLSPFLTSPLENVSVTLAGLPRVRVKGAGAGAGAEKQVEFRCSPACELASNEVNSSCVRWPLGNVSDDMQLRVIMEEEEEEDEEEEERVIVLEASVDFHSQGSISGFGLRECGLYNSTFKSGTYLATSTYALPSLQTHEEISQGS